ncbi:MAG: hypothetical protein INR71_05070 [Terriglobus roseus]|nr:hypothetical protein [Terriglobus roseus]
MSAASAVPQLSAPDVSVQEPLQTQPSSDGQGDVTPQASKADKEKKRRSFFGLGKRKESGEKTSSSDNMTSSASAPYSPVPAPSSSPGPGAGTGSSTPTTLTNPLEIPRATPHSPPRAQGHSLSTAASPARSGRLRSSSPRLPSPASSLIFERNVQESTLPDDVAKDLPIPAHIQTEDHIPAVLEASSLAITDDHLGPDEVEIVMHAAHQPAAEKVVGAGGAHTPGASDAAGASPIGGLSPIEDPGFNLHQSLEAAGSGGGPAASAPADDASNYGAIDTSDVRRLSFISFADVVQSEHAESARDNPAMQLSMSLSSAAAANRSPSPPVRSPASDPPSVKGLDISGAAAAAATPQGKAARLPPGSPTSGALSPSSGTGGGEIVVETMRQALRKTGSGDLRGAISPVEKTHEDDTVLR